MKLDDIQITYAQNREDIVISAFFSDVKKGFYVDVGANHPFYHSITKLFYDKGWRGVNIEPNPMLFEQILENRPKDINLKIGVGNESGFMDFRIYHSRDGLEGISTLSQEVKNAYANSTVIDSKKFSDIKIEVKSLKEIFQENKIAKIHFIKIDVEGFELEVLKSNDWKKYRPELICIESYRKVDELNNLLKQESYNLVFNDGLNNYYLASESMHRTKNFDYAQTFLLSKPILSYSTAEKLRYLSEELERTKEELKRSLSYKYISKKKVGAALGRIKKLTKLILKDPL